MISLNMKSVVFLGTVSLLMSACADTTSTTFWETPNAVNRPTTPEPKLDPIPEKIFERASGSARGEGLKYDPRVDILFVIDNSASMETHQRNLRTNINKFVNSLAKTKAIDFHIGVTTVHDSVRYGSVVQKACGGQVNYLENGELAPLKGVAVPAVERFVTRKEGYLSVLEATLNVGIADFKDVAPGEAGCSTGPEEEESFSPVIKSFSSANQSGNNVGFWRDGSLKVVMLVTDAEDGSKEFTASYVYDELYRLSGSTPDDQKFRVYAVTAIPGQSVNSQGYIANSRTCRLDFGFKNKTGNWPNRVPDHNVAELVKISGGKLLSICNANYGAELAKVGEEIRKATLKDIVYDLPQIPERSPGRDIQVWFRQDDKTSVALEEGKHWNYDPNLNRIVVKGFNLNWDEYPNASIDVDYYIFNQKDPLNKVIQ